jgi:hypothetical protein
VKGLYIHSTKGKRMFVYSNAACSLRDLQAEQIEQPAVRNPTVRDRRTLKRFPLTSFCPPMNAS